MLKQSFQPTNDELHDGHLNGLANLSGTNLGANLSSSNFGLSPNPMLKSRNRADSQINFQHEQFASPNLNHPQPHENNLESMLVDNQHHFIGSHVRFTAIDQEDPNDF